MTYRAVKIHSKKLTDCNDVFSIMFRAMTPEESQFTFRRNNPIRGFQSLLCRLAGLQDMSQDGMIFLDELFDSNSIRDVRYATRIIDDYKAFQKAFSGLVAFIQYNDEPIDGDYKQVLSNLGEIFLLKIKDHALKLSAVRRKLEAA